MKTLVTDLLFPSKYSKWRISEISSFIVDRGADILVFKVDAYANITYGFDYDEMFHEFSLEGYNILIFDQKYNYINKYNKRVDGTAWNGKYYGSYLFTRSLDFNPDDYGFVYHIFLNNYLVFNKYFNFPMEMQAVHLYPGGGFIDEKSLVSLHKTTKVISTTPKTSKLLYNIGHTNYIECLCAPLTSSADEKPILRKKNQGKLKVVFASMGHAAEKGDEQYRWIVNAYKERYLHDGVDFLSISIYPLSDNIKNYMPMSMKELTDFYRHNVDLIISIDTGLAFHGWPLGLEAVLTGVALATTDPHKWREMYKISDDAIFVFDMNKLDSVVSFIHELYCDRDYLHAISIKGQAEFYKLCCYSSQQEMIFNYIDGNMRY